MGKCYYYGKEKNEIKAFENHNTSNARSVEKIKADN